MDGNAFLRRQPGFFSLSSSPTGRGYDRLISIRFSKKGSQECSTGMKINSMRNSGLLLPISAKSALRSGVYILPANRRDLRMSGTKTGGVSLQPMVISFWSTDHKVLIRILAISLRKDSSKLVMGRVFFLRFNPRLIMVTAFSIVRHKYSSPRTSPLIREWTPVFLTIPCWSWYNRLDKGREKKLVNSVSVFSIRKKESFSTTS